MSNVVLIALRRLRIPLIVLILVYAMATVGMTLIPGIDDQGNVWHMDFFHAFYFVSFMGTTIGFGEIPYPFTDTQRFWVLICIYTSVIAWLYAIGTMLSLVQEPTFKKALINHSFERSIRNINQPFYIICGYGETGYLLNHGLAKLGLQTVIIDYDTERIDQIELEDLSIRTITLNADITEPKNLIAAGINHACCCGVIAVTENDHTNLQVAVSGKLLNKRIPIICRSEIDDEAKNMASFGTDAIIDPYQIFAKRLALLVHNPQLHKIQSWLINQHRPEQVSDRPLLKGRWIICGYGRFGKAIVKELHQLGIETTIIDPNPDIADAPDGIICGRGTEADTLQQAGIESAVAIVAGANDDPNNLSILMTAYQLNSNIYTIGRINKERNNPLFVQANCHYIMRRSLIVANYAITLISRPLVSGFLNASRALSDQQTEALIDDIIKLTSGKPPATWRLTLNEQHAPALCRHLQNGHTLKLKDIAQSEQFPNDRCLTLLHKSDHATSLLPDGETPLELGDQLLFVSANEGRVLAERLLNNDELIDTLVNNNHHHIPLLRWRHRQMRTKRI